MKHIRWIFIFLYSLGVENCIAQKDVAAITQLSVTDKDSKSSDLNSVTHEDNLEYADFFKKSTDILSPQATALTRYGEYPVSHATGLPQIEIPLYSIEVGNFSLPITLSYHASGNKVQDIATPVGLGWVLNAGGVISRKIKNRQDCLGGDLYSNVPFYNKAVVDSLKSAELLRPTNEAANVDFWNGVLDLSSMAYDTESDRYTYNFCGYAGVFRYSFAEKKFKTIPYEPLRIKADVEDNFVITDTKGNYYHFGVQEKSGIWDADFDVPVSSFYLTRIDIPSTNDSILLEYMEEPNNYGYPIITNFSRKGLRFDKEHPYGESDFSLQALYSDFFCNGKLLKEIKWCGGCVELDYIYDRKDLAPARLEYLTIKDMNGNIVRKVKFDASNHTGLFALEESNRLFLDGIKISGSDSTDFEKYSFEYNPTKLPPYFSIESYTFYEDYWGYYNGNAQKYYNTPLEFTDLLGTKIDGRNRTPNETYMKAGILEKIIYPTGGYTRFEYEPNKAFVEDMETILGGLRIKSIYNYNNEGEPYVEFKHYEYSGDACMPIDKYKYSYEEPYFYAYQIDDLLFEYKEDAHKIVVSEPIVPLVSAYGSTAFYTDIYEYIGSSSGNKSDYIHYSYIDGSVPHNSQDDYSSSAIDLRFFSESYNLEKGNPQPLLSKKEFYENNGDGTFQKRKTEKYHYSLYEIPSFVAGVNMKMFGIIGLDGGVNIYKPYNTRWDYFNNIKVYNITCYPSRYMLDTQVIQEYTEDGDTIVSVSSFAYDNAFRTLQRKSVEWTGSEGNTYRIEYEFPFERPDQLHQRMAIDYNLADPVISEKLYCEEVLLSTRQTDYMYNEENDWFYPQYRRESMQGQPLHERIHFKEYDTNGNLLTVVENTTDTTAVIWGYKNNYPVAKVKGCSHAALKGISGVNELLEELAVCTDSARMRTLLAELRTKIGDKVSVTTCLYRLLFGLSAITDEYGYTLYYDYYGNGRLSNIRDNDGVLQNYEYKYANP